MSGMLQEIECYWEKRSEGYSQTNLQEINSFKRQAWIDLICENDERVASKKLKILDIGTGPGFFSLVLSSLGHQVTGIDYTQAMVERACFHASLFNEDIDFYQMDAHELEFEDETFDLIITRNVTWNLERPIEAYEDWYRVLKPNGKLMNFDANWYGYIHDEEKKEEFEQNRLHSLKVNGDDNFDNIDCQKVDTNVMENIAHRLPLSKIERPKWDQYVLDDIGYDSIKVDCGIGNRIWHEGEQIKYKSTPMFMICARK